MFAHNRSVSIPLHHSNLESHLCVVKQPGHTASHRTNGRAEQKPNNCPLCSRSTPLLNIDKADYWYVAAATLFYTVRLCPRLSKNNMPQKLLNSMKGRYCWKQKAYYAERSRLICFTSRAACKCYWINSAPDWFLLICNPLSAEITFRWMELPSTKGQSHTFLSFWWDSGT